MHFVDEQDRRATVLLSYGLRSRHGLSDVLHAGKHRRNRDELGVERVGHEACKGRLPRARRSPQDHRMRLAGGERDGERLPQRQQMPLPDDIADRSRPQALGKGNGARRSTRKEIVHVCSGELCAVESRPACLRLRNRPLIRDNPVKSALAAGKSCYGPMVIPQIETAEGLANVEAIAAVPGVDALWLGHFDLTNFLGIPGGFQDPRFVAAVDRIIAACETAHKAAAFIATDDAWARDYAKKGFRLCAFGLEQLMLQTALKPGLDVLRETNHGRAKR